MSYAIAYFCRQLKLYLLHKKCPMQLLKIANDHFAIIYEDKMFWQHWSPPGHAPISSMLLINHLLRLSPIL